LKVKVKTEPGTEVTEHSVTAPQQTVLSNSVVTTSPVNETLEQDLSSGLATDRSESNSQPVGDKRSVCAPTLASESTATGHPLGEQVLQPSQTNVETASKDSQMYVGFLFFFLFSVTYFIAPV
jgi:hypothetical protein